MRRLTVAAGTVVLGLQALGALAFSSPSVPVPPVPPAAPQFPAPSAAGGAAQPLHLDREQLRGALALGARRVFGRPARARVRLTLAGLDVRTAPGRLRLRVRLLVGGPGLPAPLRDRPVTVRGRLTPRAAAGRLVARVERLAVGRLAVPVPWALDALERTHLPPLLGRALHVDAGRRLLVFDVSRLPGYPVRLRALQLDRGGVRAVLQPVGRR